MSFVNTLTATLQIGGPTSADVFSETIGSVGEETTGGFPLKFVQGRLSLFLGSILTLAKDSGTPDISESTWNTHFEHRAPGGTTTRIALRRKDLSNLSLLSVFHMPKVSSVGVSLTIRQYLQGHR